MTPKLSIVFGTLNRRPYLERAIESIRQSVGALSYEIVIAAGPSVDGSLEFLRDVSEIEGDIVIIEQSERTGAVAAFNAGFERAQGEYVAAFNDDAEYAGDELQRACGMLDERRDIGQIAIPFSLPDEKPHVDFINLWGLRLVYANFGVISRALGHRLGWWGNHYQYAGDTELSIKVWNSNLKVMPLIGGHIIHHQLKDETRMVNVESRSLRVWNDTPPPALVQSMRTGLPMLPTSRNRQHKEHKSAPRIQKGQRSKLLGIEGMTLVKYLGDGLIVSGAPTGTEYRFSGGACLYVDDRDLIFVFSKARGRESLTVI